MGNVFSRFLMMAGLFWLTSSTVSAQKVYELDACIRMSLDHNLQVKNGEIDLQSVQSRINEAKSGFLPSVDITGQYQYYLSMPKMLVPAEMFGGTAGDYAEVSFGSEQTSSMGLQVSQSLYNQRVFIGLKAAKTAKNMSDLQLGKTKEDLIYNVSAVYYNLQMIQSNLALLDGNIALIERIWNVNKSLQANEIISKTNLKRLDVNLENLRSEQRNLQLTNKKAYNLLKFLLGVPLTEDIAVVPLDASVYPIHPVNDATDIENRTDLKLVKEQIQLAELDKKATMAEFYPSLSGVYNYGITGYNNKVAPFQTLNDRWMKSSYIALQLNIPVFSGLSRFQRVKQKDFEVVKAKNTYELLRQSAEKDLADAKNNFLSSTNSFESAQRNLGLAQEVFQSATIEYQNSLLSLSDVLQIQNELTSSRTAFSNALIAMKQAEIELKKSVGKLSETY